MTQPQSGEVIDHLHWLTVDFQDHHVHLADDEVKVGVRLLEVILARWCSHEEGEVDALPEGKSRGLVQGIQQLRQGFLPGWRTAHRLQEQPLHILPEPGPGDFMGSAPVLWEQRPQRGQHAGLVLGELHLARRDFGDSQDKDVALLCKARRIGHVFHDVVEASQNLIHPDTFPEAHDGRIEEEHLVVRPRYALDRLQFVRFLSRRAHEVTLAHVKPHCCSLAPWETPLLLLLALARIFGCLLLMLFLRIVLLIEGAELIVVGAFVVGDLPTLRQDLQTV
mmetsp:Transcript_45939/g.99793  ORF Transcript_45939/g.99793 Transcript_45939/m.99793 type:complete len:279 (-) Transcript_45939:688-1524(-)